MTRDCKCPPGCAFHWRGDNEGDFVPAANWYAFKRYAQSGETQTAVMERKRAQGVTVPSVPLFTRKAKGKA